MRGKAVRKKSTSCSCEEIPGREVEQQLEQDRVHVTAAAAAQEQESLATHLKVWIANQLVGHPEAAGELQILTQEININVGQANELTFRGRVQPVGTVASSALCQGAGP
jgi:hypothetical protein